MERPLEEFIYPMPEEDMIFQDDMDYPLEIVPSAETMPLDDGSMIISFEESIEEDQPEFGDNLADWIDDSDLRAVASDLIGAFNADKRSRKDWEKTYMEGLDLLGLKFEERTEPWDGACGVFHPLLTDSVVRFQAQTIQEIFPASGPVKVSVVGRVNNEKAKQASRVREFMNYSATKRMPEYRNETERLLFSLPIAGSAFRKIYYDPSLGREAAMFVPAEDFVVSYGASDLSTCERATHIMKRDANYVRKLQVDGFYSDIDLLEPAPDVSDLEEKTSELTGQQGGFAEHDSRYTLLEMHVDYDLPGFEDEKDGEPTGIKLPYVITIEKSSSQVLAIRRNWLEDDPKKLKREHFVHYQYLPGLGFYGFGLVHMIGGLSKSATSLLRQLVDAGTLANLPGGLKTRGLRIKGDDTPILPGEFRDVDVHSGAIKDNIAFLPYKEPSSVLYQLLGDLVNEGRRFASAADVKASDMNAEAPVGTTLAILEREMKVMSAVQARVHEAMGRELAILADIIRQFGPDEYPYEIEGEYTLKEDFDERVDIIPVSDPNAGTMAQRIMQYQAALQLAAQAPQIYDIPLLHRQMLEVLGIQQADKIVPTDDDMRPQDPITETMNLIKGDPIKVFRYQDHEAHIQAHMAAMQNPELMEMLQQNPKAQQIQAAGAAHIAEHVAFLYREKIEKEVGTQIPTDEDILPEDIEIRLSRLVAPAAAQLTGKAAQQKKAQEDAQQQQDPIIQMRQEELRQKGAKIEADKQRDAQKLQNELQIAMEKLQVERDKLELQAAKLQKDAQLGEAKITASVVSDQADNAMRSKEITSNEQIQGYRMGLDMARDILEGVRRQQDEQSRK